MSRKVWHSSSFPSRFIPKQKFGSHKTMEEVKSASAAAAADAAAAAASDAAADAAGERIKEI